MMDFAETQKLDHIAQRHDTHADFDGVLAFYSGRIIAPQLRGLRVLECGCSTGVMTPMLLESARELEVVEGSKVYAGAVEQKFSGRLKMFCSLFENFDPPAPYDAAVVAGVLHHLERPLEVLQRIAAWVRADGVLHVTVPSMTSFHRQLGVAMGVAQAVDSTSERNKFFKQPGRFTKDRLVELVTQAGLRTLECRGFFFKPFPHEIMNSLALPENLLDGLFEMGRQYPELACQLYLKAGRF